MSQRRVGNKSRDNKTQQTLEESFGEAINLDEAANNVVRYIVMRSGEHANFSKSELKRNVLHKAGSKFEDIMAKVRPILREVYGYNLLICDTAKGKDKHYVVSNILPHINDPSDNPEDIPEDINRVLLLLILSHIFMSNNTVSDVSLYTFLKSLRIDVDLRHPMFGHVKDYINKTLIKEHYLITEVDNISKRQTFKWGIRAEQEISKMAVLEFVCKMYKDKQPKDWVNQYNVAGDQAFENHMEDPAAVEEN